MRAAYSSQTQAHLRSDAQYNAIKSSDGPTHTQQKKTQNQTKHIDLLSPQLLSTQHKHAVEKTSDSSLSLHPMRNYWRALKSARPRVTSLISYRSETLQKALQSPSSKQNPQLLHIPDFDFHEAVSAFQSAPFPVCERGFFFFSLLLLFLLLLLLPLPLLCAHVMKAKFHINKRRAAWQLRARAFSREFRMADEREPPEPP